MASTGSLRAGGAFVEISADSTQLRKSLKAIKGRLRAFQASVNASSRAFGGLGGGLVGAFSSISRAATGLTSIVGGAFSSIGGHVSRLASDFSQMGFIVGGAGIALGLGIKSAITVFAEFDTSIRSATAIARGGAETFQMLSKRAQDLGASTSFTAREVASSMRVLALAGQSAEEIMGTIAIVLDTARGTMTGLDDTTRILVNTLRQFELGVEESRRAADTLAIAANSSTQVLFDLGESMKFVAPIAQGLGVNLEETATALALLANAGIRGTIAGTQLGRVLKEISKRPKQKKLENYLGFDIRKEQSNAVDLLKLFTSLREKTKGLSNLDRLGVFEEVFGRGNVAAQILTKGTVAFDEMTRKIIEGRLETLKLREAIEAGVGGAALLAKSAVEGLSLTFSEVIQPEVLGIIRGFTEIIRNVREWVRSNRDIVVQYAKIGAGLSIAAAGILVFSLGFKAAQLAASSFFQVIAIAISPAILAVRLLSHAISSGLSIAFSTASAAASLAITAITTALSVVSAIAPAIAGAISLAPLGAGLLLVLAPLLALIGAIKGVSKVAAGIGESLASSYTVTRNSFASMAKSGVDAATMIRKNWIYVFDGIGDLASSAMSAFSSALLSGDVPAAFKVLLAGVSALWDQFVDNLQSSGLIAAFETMFNEIKHAAISLFISLRHDLLSALRAGGIFERSSRELLTAEDPTPRNEMEKYFFQNQQNNLRQFEKEKALIYLRDRDREERLASQKKKSAKELAKLVEREAKASEARNKKAMEERQARKDEIKRQIEELDAANQRAKDIANEIGAGSGLPDAEATKTRPIGTFSGRLAPQLAGASRNQLTAHERTIQDLLSKILGEQKRGKPLVATNR